MKIKTQCICPPIPIRQFDWIAYDDDIYDGALDSHCVTGHGATEQEAITNFKQVLEESGDLLCWNCGHPESEHAAHGDRCPGAEEDLIFSAHQKFSAWPPSEEVR